jgi:tRNA (cmo5U34)-methyltransferase
LQFLPINTRIKIIKDIYNKLPKGGCFILSEKIFIDNGKMQDIYNFSHYDYKEKTFSANDIFKKQKDLRRIMKPITEKENIDYIKEAGFTNVESFWQNLLFKAWVCIK